MIYNKTGTLCEVPSSIKNSCMSLQLLENQTSNENIKASVIERIAAKIRLNRCDKCHCLRVRHDLHTGQCKDCGCINPRQKRQQKGMDFDRLFDLEGSA